jgi:hypothetical protein
MKYERKHWRLVGNRVMWHVPLGIGYYIWTCGQVLTGIAVRFRDADMVLCDDEEALGPVAVKAYLDVIYRKLKKAIPN